MDHNRIDPNPNPNLDATGEPLDGICQLNSLEILELGFNQISSISALRLERTPKLRVRGIIKYSPQVVSCFIYS